MDLMSWLWCIINSVRMFCKLVVSCCMFYSYFVIPLLNYNGKRRQMPSGGVTHWLKGSALCIRSEHWVEPTVHKIHTLAAHWTSTLYCKTTFFPLSSLSATHINDFGLDNTSVDLKWSCSIRSKDVSSRGLRGVDIVPSTGVPPQEVLVHFCRDFADLVLHHHQSSSCSTEG